MKKIGLIHLLLLSIVNLIARPAASQEPTIPELRQKIPAASNDTVKIGLEQTLWCMLVSQQTADSSTIDSAEKIASRTEKLSKKLKYNDGIINAMLLSSLANGKKGKRIQQFLLLNVPLNTPKKPIMS